MDDAMGDASVKKQEPTKSPTPTMAQTPTGSSRTPTSSLTVPTSATSSYFPGCRKDANCHCEMCLASIDATRDLMSCNCLSTNSRSRPLFTPVKPKPRSDLPQPRFTPLAPATPPMLRSTAKSRVFDGTKVVKQENPAQRVMGYRALGIVALIVILWVVDSGLVMNWFQPQLEREIIGRIGEEFHDLSEDLHSTVGFVQERLRPLIKDDAPVRDCKAHKSVWVFNQGGGGHFFHWRCVVYKSMAEEVSIWGSPLRTSGLLSTTLSSRHLTVLSGKITEWSDGVPIPTARGRNSSSWTRERWSYAAVQLDPETWVLEYRRNALFEGTRLIPTIGEILLSKMSEKVKRLKRGLSSGHYKAGQAVPAT